MLRFVINLDNSLDRWVSMCEKFDSLGLEVERVSAIDKKKLTKEEILKLTKVKTMYDKAICPRSLFAGEIACFLSHKLCWEKLRLSKENFALVMEDDIKFSARTENYLSSLDWVPKGVHLVQLSTLNPAPVKTKVDRVIVMKNGDTLVHPLYPVSWGTQAYLISKPAAMLALKLTKNIGMPVDDFLFHPMSLFSRKYPVYKLNPSIIIHEDIKAFSSTLEINPEAKSTRKSISLDRLLMQSIYGIKVLICRKQKILYFS